MAMEFSILTEGTLPRDLTRSLVVKRHGRPTSDSPDTRPAVLTIRNRLIQERLVSDGGWFYDDEGSMSFTVSDESAMDFADDTLPAFSLPWDLDSDMASSKYNIVPFPQALPRMVKLIQKETGQAPSAAGMSWIRLFLRQVAEDHRRTRIVLGIRSILRYSTLDEVYGIVRDEVVRDEMDR